MEITCPMLPREKLLKDGVATLTDTELLALFLRTGTRGKNVFTLASEMLEHFGSLYSLLSAELVDFERVEGIGIAKYAQLKGIAELARRYYVSQMHEDDSLLSPDQGPHLFTKPAK